MRMLIADDDKPLGTFLARGLERDGHEITVATDGEMAIELAGENPPEMALLDLNLPRREGTEVLEFLRTLAADLPILVLTARPEPEMRLRCLEMGADDFMQKPFSFSELRARCRALLRRRPSGMILRYGTLEMNRIEHIVRRDGEIIMLTNKEFALLEYLMLHRGCTVSRSVLLERVWSLKPDANTNVVDVYVNYVRRKLRDTLTDNRDRNVPQALEEKPNAPLIRTVRGRGYCIGTPS